MTAGYRHVEQARAFEPTDAYVELREQCPVHFEADHTPPFYVLTRYDDVAAAARRPSTFQSRYGGGVFFQESGALGTADDPDHARHRRVLKSAFVPSAIDAMAPRIEALAAGLLDAMLPLGTGDFIEHFAFPLPALVIAELLGVPPSERDAFHRWSNLAVSALTGGDIDGYRVAKTALEDTVERGVRVRLDQKDDREPDVLSLLADALRDHTLTLVEVRHLGYQLLVAGHETTTSLLGLLLYRLLERPELLDRIRRDHALLQPAIEEGLRFDSPVHGLFRTTSEPCPVAGTTIPEGMKVQLLFASANRDPAHFDAPDEFRIDRDHNELMRHIAFGWGIHHCLGAQLARLTARIALRQLLDRTSHLELAGVAVRNDSFVLHGLVALPIRWIAS